MVLYIYIRIIYDISHLDGINALPTTPVFFKEVDRIGGSSIPKMFAHACNWKKTFWWCWGKFILSKEYGENCPQWRFSSVVMWHIGHGSLYYQPKQCIVIFGKSLKITKDLYCLIPPRWVIPPKWVIQNGYTPYLSIGYNPLTNHLLTSCDIQEPLPIPSHPSHHDNPDLQLCHLFISKAQATNPAACGVDPKRVPGVPKMRWWFFLNRFFFLNRGKSTLGKMFFNCLGDDKNWEKDLRKNHLPAPSKGCQINPKGWLIDTL